MSRTQTLARTLLSPLQLPTLCRLQYSFSFTPHAHPLPKPRLSLPAQDVINIKSSISFTDMIYNYNLFATSVVPINQGARVR